MRPQIGRRRLQHDEVIDLATRDGSQGLIKQDHALLDSVVVHKTRAEVGQRGEHKIGVTLASANQQRVGVVLFLACPDSLEHAFGEGDPASLRRVWLVYQKGLAREIQPAPIAQSPLVVPCR